MEQKIMEVLRQMQQVINEEQLGELKNVMNMVFAGCELAENTDLRVVERSWMEDLEDFLFVYFPVLHPVIGRVLLSCVFLVTEKIIKVGGFMLIKFLNEESIKQCTIKKISSHVIELRGVEQNLSGFHVVKENGAVYGKYEDYTTLYREVQGGFLLSNDGSVYVEPEPIPEPEPIEPTIEELKQQKMNEVSAVCKETIHAGVDVELPTGSTEHFSLKEEDQINLFGKQAQISAGVTQLEYHQDGHPCRYYTVEEMTAIITASMQYVSYHTTYCNSLYTWINAVTDKEDLKEITYGVTIPIEYQSEVLQTYLLNM